jgi:pSer/pThr/pTyr-binding forkhead associated (FHA) protein
LLFVPGFDRPIPIEGDQSVILGRNLENNSGPQGEVIFDLSPFEALDSGVSRRHALVRPVDDGFEICDMGSTNGTWLDQTRILPGQPYRLKDASEIRLGRMVVHLVVRVSRRRTSSLAA